MESWVGPVYFVIFSYWGRPVPYLELFGGGPVKKNTLQIRVHLSRPHAHMQRAVIMLTVSITITLIAHNEDRLQCLISSNLSSSSSDILITNTKEDEFHRNGHSPDGVCVVFNLPLKKTHHNDTRIVDQGIGGSLSSRRQLTKINAAGLQKLPLQSLEQTNI